LASISLFRGGYRRRSSHSGVRLRLLRSLGCRREPPQRRSPRASSRCRRSARGRSTTMAALDARVRHAVPDHRSGARRGRDRLRLRRHAQTL